MDNRTRFIHEENVANFARHLNREANLPLHDQQRQLLLEEWSRFGPCEERLTLLDGYIASNWACIQEQQTLISQLKAGDRRADCARQMLCSLETTRTVYLDHRAMLLDLRRTQFG